MKTPYLFDEFFAAGREESISPFLTPSSRVFGKNLSLKSAASSAILLALAFALSFSSPSLSSLFLLFVYFLVGIPALLATMEDLKNFEINIDVLMTTAAFLAVLIDSALEGALLLVLFQLSHGMEDAVSNKAKSALHHLNYLAPKIAYLVADDGLLVGKSVREVQVGEKLLVKHGEIVPLDGTVISGKSSVNLVHLTGESLPVAKGPGDTLAAGSKNLESALTIEVTRISNDSTLNRIIQLITQAQEAKPQLQRWLDKFGKRYATAIIILTFFFALALPLIFSAGYLGHEGSIYRALAFLIAASPCALIIATPTAYLSAISACAKRGILLKGGVTLDALTTCKTIAFDKTGTLTTGELICSGMEAFGSPLTPIDEALQIAYGIERQVVHPIATAICKYAEDRQLRSLDVEHFLAVPGTGVEAQFQGKPVFLGLADAAYPRIAENIRPQVQEWVHQAKESMIALLMIGKDLFLFRFSDPVRTDTAPLIASLKKKNNLIPVMLTGDHLQNAQKVGQLVGIDAVYADLRPEEKLAKVAEFSEKGGLAMVGDGINDAPALARATVGISMGKIGSATAVDASDVVLLNDDLPLLSWLFSKARQTGSIVRQNLTLAFCVIAFATIPALLGLIPLWAAVLLHEGGTVLVGINSLRLLRR